ncbi:MAG: cellulase family glycosylhydrolase [Actinobacteria bacterium]|nr:cellulase family glycosylhydrolase [Actinomycetota bacterium]
MQNAHPRIRKGLVAGLAALVVTMIAVPAVGADPTLPGPGSPTTIEANGRWFPTDAQGRALDLHGYNIKLHADQIATITLAQLQGLRRNGFTLLRLAIFWSDMEPTQGTWNNQYFTDLGHVLDLAQTAGVKVVLDMHQDSFSPAVGGYGMPDWATRTDGLVYHDTAIPCLDAANQRAWQHFYEDADLRAAQTAAWTEVVSRLGSKPAVFGYDLLNEPCGQMNAGEGYTDALTRVEATQITPMLQRVTDAIRATDTTHWIFLEGAFGLTSSFAAPSGLGPVHDPTGRQIYAPHLYDLGMESGADWNPSSDFVTRYYSNIVTYGATNHIPTIVLEWGPQKPALPNAADYVSQVMHGADAHVAGWAAFAWCQGLGGWCQLDSNGNPGAGMTDNTQVYPMAIAGRPISIQGNYAAGTSIVTVDPTDPGATGPTEFYFPLRRFPSGPNVSVDLPAGEWSSSWNADTQTLSVTVNSRARHTITVWPQGTTQPEGTTTTTSTTTSSTVPPSSTIPPGSSTTTGAVQPSASTNPGSPTSTPPSGTLPATGAPIAPLVVIGSSLIALGLALDVIRRRRRIGP